MSSAGGVEFGRRATAGRGAQTVWKSVGGNRKVAAGKDRQFGEESLELDHPKKGTNRKRIDVGHPVGISTGVRKISVRSRF